MRQSHNSNGDSSGGKNSEEWASSGQSGEEISGNFKFELDDQTFSKEEEELFNQLRAAELEEEPEFTTTANEEEE